MHSSLKRHGDADISILSKKLIVSDLIVLLNKAYADEWIAYYQYWVCAKLVEGPTRITVAKELAEHAQEEHNHAENIANRIIQLGGLPLLSPDQWKQNSGCGYDATKNAYVKAVLEENIKAEQCAIKFYNELLIFLDQKDPITYDLILGILQDEVKHEQDLVRLLGDLQSLENIPR